MSEITDGAIFAREVQRKLDELINWIVDNAPVTNNALLPRDFSQARQSIYQTATGNTEHQNIETEPEQGGAQYINDNPAPWP